VEQYLQAVVTVLSLVNPVICGAIFSEADAGQPFRTQFVDATKAALAVLVILLLSAFFGAAVLKQFGVSLDAFRVAGGGVLAWMGFGMLTGKSPAPGSGEHQTDEPSIVPLVLFAASPGTITGVITLAIHHAGTELPVAAMVAVCIAVSVMWVLILAAARFGGSRRGLVHDTSTRFMGLIVVAMGVQFALAGIQAFMNS